MMLIIVGMAFMLNPMLAIVDILPDFIGCALILIGLYRISSISPELNDARPYFKYMLYVSLARTVVVFVSGNFDDIMQLSVTLIFGVIEFGLAVMAIPALYDGLSYLNIRYGGSPKEAPEFKTVGMIFFAARGFFAVLPQLGSVITISDDELIGPADQVVTDWSAYSGIITLAGAVLTLIFAVFWYTAVISYIGKLTKDKDFVSALKAAYQYKRETDPGYYIRRRLLGAFMVFTAGSFFLIDLLGDGINYIPDFVFGFCALAAIWAISPYSDKKSIIKGYIFGGIYTVFSIANFIYFNIFMKNRFFAPFDQVIARFLTEYILALSFAFAEAAALILFAHRIFYAFLPIVEQQTTLDTPAEFVRTARSNEKYITGTKRLLAACCISIAVTGVSTLLLSALLLIMPLYWMIHLALNITAFCLTMALTTRLTIGVRRRYERPEDII